MSDAGDDDAASSALHWYDFVCPFCYVGQVRTALLMEVGLEVISLPFQAHPDIPAGGLLVGPRRGPMYSMLEQQAAAVGLELHWPARIPNSRKALATAEWVRRNQPGAFVEVHHKLFEARFALGEDIDNQAVIDRHAANAGVDLGALHTALRDLSQMWTRLTDQPEAELLIALREVKAENAIEAGLILPEPGHEQQWLEANDATLSS